MKTLKEVPLARIQDAFSKALSEITGREYMVVLHGLQFDPDAAGGPHGTEGAVFSGQIDGKLPSMEDDPFAALTWMGGLLN